MYIVQWKPEAGDESDSNEVKMGEDIKDIKGCPLSTIIKLLMLLQKMMMIL